MRVLVTGGAGFIGSKTVDTLHKHGHEVVVLDNESAVSNKEFYWNEDIISAGYKGDICDTELVNSIFFNEKPDAVLHCAAQARIQIGYNSPIDTYKTNYLGTVTLLEACKEHKCKRFVFSSTSSCYGLRNSIPLREDCDTDCLTPYSISKVAAEEACKQYHKNWGVETLILRYFNVYGDRQPLKGPYAPVIGLFHRQREANQEITIVGNGKQTRDFTHIDDVVDANILALTGLYNKGSADYPGDYGEVYNIGSGQNYSIEDVAKMISPRGPFIYTRPRPGEAVDTRADNTKAKKVLNWKPTIELPRWIKENY